MWRVNKATEILCGRPLNPSQKLVLVLDASESFHYSDQYSSAGCSAWLFPTTLVLDAKISCSPRLLADTHVDKIALKDKI